MAARASLALAGLSPRCRRRPTSPPPPRLCCLAFGTGTGALLLLRSRGGHGTRALVFAAGAIVTTATTFGVAAWSAPLPGPWVAATTATLVAAALYLGCCSPVLSRAADLLEWLALAALVPLTCWIAGLYGTVRGLTLG